MKLFAYGCSWTYYLATKDFIKFWPELVAKELKINFINNGYNGFSNFESTNRLIKDLHLIQQNDIVVFQFTFPNRLKVNYLDDDKWYYNFKLENNNYNKEDYLLWLDFVNNFNLELLLKDFYNTKPLFEHIEKNIGAKVRYWFSSCSEILTYNKNSDMLNDNFIIMENIDYSINLIEYLEKNNMTLSDDFKNGVLKDENFKYDKHTNQDGHNFIAKYVVESLK
jgi:hypothetical protein